ncbi:MULTISPECIES: hypothetical protein [Pseudomonadati]|uniref:Uncharacterized protein n=1 Tax=Shewanella aestuarii TaxID=1028752 RepID=A0ABT0L4Y7_9GAMM|nr:hypothetical protein [Shewanella aestuarii]MCL1118797.1 hypothetical protein [Shewanella aestuarii]GGN83540.1 hypothetical protein GCM10009193_31870 [Shewanella aestuarii]
MKRYFISAMFLAVISTSALAGDINFEVSEHVVSAEMKASISSHVNMGGGLYIF